MSAARPPASATLPPPARRSARPPHWRWARGRASVLAGVSTRDAAGGDKDEAPRGTGPPYGKIKTHFDRRCDSLLSQIGALIHCLGSTERHIPFLVADCARPESQMCEKLSQITWPGATSQSPMRCFS